MPSGMLEVLLVAATGIKNTDFFGKSDPYAVISCWRQSFKSKTAKDEGTKPVWNQKFNFFIEEGVNELFVKLYDEDTLTEDDFIGSSRIPLDKVLKEKIVPTSPYDVVCPNGEKKGVVFLNLEFEPKTATATCQV